MTLQANYRSQIEATKRKKGYKIDVQEFRSIRWIELRREPIIQNLIPRYMFVSSIKDQKLHNHNLDDLEQARCNRDERLIETPSLCTSTLERERKRPETRSNLKFKNGVTKGGNYRAATTRTEMTSRYGVREWTTGRR